MPTIRVDLGSRSYDVLVEGGNLPRVGRLIAAWANVRQAVVICDSNVAGLYAAAAAESMARAGIATGAVTFPAGEENKTLATYGHVIDSIFALRPVIDRDTVIVALGGGVTGDLSGFVAATALRGLRWVQCPTTLLADVDASVGGKTGVDHASGKNLIGAFHQPSAVVIDVRALKTLPTAGILDGLAECVKHGVIADAELLDFIGDNRAAILAADEQAMTQLVARNVSIKAETVSADEREAGRRALLNFGHTIGHAIETIGGFGAISHGQAVSLGMVAACRLAVTRKLITAADEARVAGLLEELGLPTRWSGDADEAWQIMQHDKKARGGRVRMVLPTAIGAVKLFDDVSADEILDAIKSLQP